MKGSVRRGVAWAGLLGVALAGVMTASRNWGQLAVLRAEQPGGDPFPPPKPRVGPDIPPDVEIPKNFPTDRPPTQYFDDYSWRAFLALNWPAKDPLTKRGVPDKDAKLGDPGARVWDTYKASWEIFQPKGERPSVWDSYEAIPPCADTKVARGNDRQARLFGRFAFSSKGGAVLDDVNQAGFPAPLGSLTAQNKTYVSYEIRVNRGEFEKIRGTDNDKKSWLYLGDNLPPPWGQGPASIAFPNGSLEIKAAWRAFKLPEEEALLKRYYHVTAEVFNPATEKCEPKTMGLVGMHIVQKTPTRPQWIWSTFEHVDNAPLTGSDPAAAKWTFNDGDPQKQGIDKANRLLPVVKKDQGPQPNPDPVQVIRLVDLPAETKKANDLYRNAPGVAGTVWANYFLVRTQWPTVTPPTPVDTSQPYPQGAGNPFPALKVANCTMETRSFLQTSNSCLECHLNAGPVDFVWFLPVRARGTSAEALKAAAKKLTTAPLAP